MLILMTGGAGSGKSALAEQYAIDLAHTANSRPIYIATMRRDPGDPETEDRIHRHRDMRAGKGFITYEIPCNIRQVAEHDGREQSAADAGKACISEGKMKKCGGRTAGGTPARRVYLLEDLPNLLANELWYEDGAMAETARSIRDPAVDTAGAEALSALLETELTGPLMKISEKADIVIVTGDVFSEGSAVDAWTDLYMQLLSKAGRVLAEAADRVVEAVSGLPVVLKS